MSFPVKLSPERLDALRGIYSTAGFQAVLDIMEARCNATENEFIGVVPGNDKAVIATHAVMHAQRIFFQEVVEKIDFLMREAGVPGEIDNRRR